MTYERADDDPKWYRRADGSIYSIEGFRVIATRRWFGVRFEWFEPDLVAIGVDPHRTSEWVSWKLAGVMNATWLRIAWVRWMHRAIVAYVDRLVALR